MISYLYRHKAHQASAAALPTEHQADRMWCNWPPTRRLRGIQCPQMRPCSRSRRRPEFDPLPGPERRARPCSPRFCGPLAGKTQWAERRLLHGPSYPEHPSDPVKSAQWRINNCLRKEKKKKRKFSRQVVKVTDYKGWACWEMGWRDTVNICSCG